MRRPNARRVAMVVMVERRPMAVVVHVTRVEHSRLPSQAVTFSYSTGRSHHDATLEASQMASSTSEAFRWTSSLRHRTFFPIQEM